MRLFPIPYRFLDADKRFRKYQWIEATIQKAADPRPESYTIDTDSIKILSEPISPKNAWAQRKKVVLPLVAHTHCLCCLKQTWDDKQKRYPRTLAVFRPGTTERLTIRPEEEPTWSEQELSILRQPNLFKKAPPAELEKVPHAFRYKFRCDHDNCRGHELKCTDWEMGESWRKWKTAYGLKWEEKFRQRYETEMITKKDLYFFVGTLHPHPREWIIVGLFYPPKVSAPAQGELYN